MVARSPCLVLAPVGLTLAIAAGACGTDAGGVGSCRQVEEARCRAALGCNISLATPVHNGDDVAACIRFYDDACLHGLEVADPGALEVNQCVALIGNPAGDGGQKNCDIVANPQNYPACAWLSPSPTDAGPTNCTVVNLSGSWTFVPDVAGGSESVSISAQSSASVTASFSSSGGTCGCNAQHFVIPLGTTFSCSSTTLEFGYASTFASNSSDSPGVEIRFSTGAPASEPPSYSGDMFAGSNWNGHSLCAFPFGWNDTFPSTAQVVNNGTASIPLNPSNTSTSNGWGTCTTTFDTLDIHLQYSGCSAGSGSVTLSNVQICPNP
jgi:hypothetical protein